ncbi:MAG: TonB-dependent receptor [Halioglobus sp.]|nr:TonB-dependent receptor [Halioglobus sp.]
MLKIRPITPALALALYGTGALAQGMVLEEVIVTAQKRSESLQDVPMAVNAFSADTIQEAGINNTADLAIMTPSLHTLNVQSPFTTKLQIRGIGTAQSDPALEPSVGVFIDGVFLGRSGLGMSDLTDIERIEVLQGPQGTLYGKNTNAGAISIITKRPSLEGFEGYVEASVGDYDMGNLTLSVTGPLSDTVAFRLSGNVHQRDGYMENSGATDGNDADDWNVQGKLLWEPNDRLSLMLSGSHVDRDNTCCVPDAIQGDTVQAELAKEGLPQVKNDPRDYNVATNVDSEFALESDMLSLHIDYDLGWGSITSITAWNDYEYDQKVDQDRSSLDIIGGESEPYSGDSLSQELRLDSQLGDDIDYQVGLFYYDQETQRGDGSTTVVLGDDFLTIVAQEIGPVIRQIAAPGDYLFGKLVWDNNTFAVFSQATWHISERWHLTGGLRWTDEEREADLFSDNVSTAPAVVAGLATSYLGRLSASVDDTFNRSSDNVDWLLKAAYDLGDSTMVYASAATGNKSGNFNGVNGTPDQREFDDEDTLSYELGAKSTLLDSRLRLNSAIFYTEVDDYQFQQGLPDGGTIVSNAAEVEVSGLDLQIEALPLENLTVTAGLLYMHKYEVVDGPLDGKELSTTPEYTANLGATLVFPLADGALYLRGDYMYMDDHVTNNSNEPDDEAYQDRESLNAKLGWRNDNWNLSVWGKNLTDDGYAGLTSQVQRFSGSRGYYLTPPRTYGVTLRYDFY